MMSPLPVIVASWFLAFAAFGFRGLCGFSSRHLRTDLPSCGGLVVLMLLTSFTLGSSLRVSAAALGSQPWELGSLNFCSREFPTRICFPSLWGVLYVFLSQSRGAAILSSSLSVYTSTMSFMRVDTFRNLWILATCFDGESLAL